jgi:hypothetical protein
MSSRGAQGEIMAEEKDESPMISIIKLGLSAAGIICNGELTFYRWVDGSPEGLLNITTVEQFTRMLVDEESELFFMDMDHLHVEGITPHPIQLDKLGFKLGFTAGVWNVSPTSLICLMTSSNRNQEKRTMKRWRKGFIY